MFIVCFYLFFLTHSSFVEHSIGRWAYQFLVIAICYFCLVNFGSGNVALASFPNNNINKGRWTHDKHNIFMQEYEKYGNNCMQIAKVLSTRTPAWIKKHAGCFFKQILKTNSAAVKQYWESLPPDRKAQVKVKHATEQQKYQQSISQEEKAQMLTNNTDTERKWCKSLPPETKIKILETCCTQEATQVSLSWW